MSFPRYPKYKDSGVEGLGEVPEHWDVKRVRYVAHLNPSKFEVADVSRQTPVSFLPMEAIGTDGSLDLDRSRPIAEVEEGYTYFRDGDVVIAKITPCFENGKGAIMSGLTNGIGFGTTELIAVRPRSGAVTSEYLHMLFSSDTFKRLGESHMYGAGGQKRVPDNFVKGFATAFPPLAEQRAIVRFLKCEIRKIDALIGEQHHLIALLREGRQAVISHVVTKGLSPNVPMRASGVESIGDVPSHWEVVRLGRKIELQRGVDITRDEQSSGDVPVVSSGGITSFHDRALVSAPGVVIGRKGTAGAIYYVMSDFWPHDTTLYVKNFGGNVPRFVYYKLLSMDIASFDTGSANPTINRNIVHPTVVSWAPVEEQAAIVDFLNATTAKSDALVEIADAAIALLRERRTALISAAVTGKIDVRNYAGEQAEAA